MSKTIYQVVGKVQGNLKTSTFTREILEQIFEVQGINKNSRQRIELQDQPKLKGMFGPMYNGMENGNHIIRYESSEVFKILSV